MKLAIVYTGGKEGFKLEQGLQADIAEDAEALGYITNVLLHTAVVLSHFLANANPKYQNRIGVGVATSEREKEREQNDKYPFTTFLVKDE